MQIIRPRNHATLRCRGSPFFSRHQICRICFRFVAIPGRRGDRLKCRHHRPHTNKSGNHEFPWIIFEDCHNRNGRHCAINKDPQTGSGSFICTKANARNISARIKFKILIKLFRFGIYSLKENIKQFAKPVPAKTGTFKIINANTIELS